MCFLVRILGVKPYRCLILIKMSGILCCRLGVFRGWMESNWVILAAMARDAWGHLAINMILRLLPLVYVQWHILSLRGFA